MEDIYNNRMNPRDPYYYEARYPDRLHPPKESPADKIAFVEVGNSAARRVGFGAL